MAESYGVIGGEAAKLFRLGNPNALRVCITDFGARIVSLKFPDRAGRTPELVCNYNDPARIANDKSYLGATVGRFANRIGAGTFVIDGKTHQVLQNEGKNTLHGGDGFDKRVWSCVSESETRLVLKYVSPDAEAGFPGEVETRVTFDVTDTELHISYSATTTKPTVINLTNHAYFNLGGVASGSIMQHELRIDAERYTESTAELIPTGKLLPVEGSALDFRNTKPIGRDVAQLPAMYAGGYDHNFVLKPAGKRPQVELRDPVSGRSLTLETSKPGLQLYTGNFLDGSVMGTEGVIGKNAGLCLETQNLPDAPNHSDFPNSVLRPGERYEHWTRITFSNR